MEVEIYNRCLYVPLKEENAIQRFHVRNVCLPFFIAKTYIFMPTLLNLLEIQGIMSKDSRCCRFVCTEAVCLQAKIECDEQNWCMQCI